MSRWRAAAARISAAAESRLLSRPFSRVGTPAPQPPCRAFSKASAAASRGPTAAAATSTASGARPEVRLNSMFLSKPCSLALPPDSPLRVEDPKFEGIKHLMLTLLLFYSKQSKSIRGANVVYHRITSQVDKSDIFDVFQLEKTFKTTFSLLVLHMWLILRRLKEEGRDGVKFGQYIYEIYNHDVELRVSKAGVSCSAILALFVSQVLQIHRDRKNGGLGRPVHSNPIGNQTTGIQNNVHSDPSKGKTQEHSAT